MAYDDKAYDEAPEPERPMDLPAGPGQYQIYEMSFPLNPSRQKSIVKFHLQGADGGNQGCRGTKSQFTENANNLSYLKADISTCGITLAKLSDIEARAGEFVGLVLACNVVFRTLENKKTVCNIYFNSLVERRELTANTAAEPAPAPKEEFPF